MFVSGAMYRAIHSLAYRFPSISDLIHIELVSGLVRARGELDRIEPMVLDFLGRTGDRSLEWARADDKTVIIDAPLDFAPGQMPFEQPLNLWLSAHV